jgi:ribonuclease P protein component
MAASASFRKVSKSTSQDTPRPDPARSRFPKSARLRVTGEFSKVREQGKASQARLLRIGLLKTELNKPARIGIITSKRVGAAVDRNKVRRRIRELVRASLQDLTPGCLIVIVAKSASAKATFQELRSEWLLLARRLSILPASE